MITPELTNQIFDSMSMGILMLDRDIKVKYWNKWLELNSGISSGTIKGKRISEFFPEIDTPRFRRNVKSVFKLGNYCYFSQKLHSHMLKFKVLDTAGASIEHMQQNCTMGPLKGSDGNIDLVFLTVRDVTDNVRMEFILNELATFVQNDPAPVLRVNREGGIIYANPATNLLLGKDPVGMRMSEIFQAYGDLLATMDKGMELSQFESYIHGKAFLFSVREDAITDSYYVYGSNISDLKSAEESLRKANASLDMRVKEKTRELIKELNERKRVEETLRISENSLKKAQEIGHVGSWHLDIEKNILTWSDEEYRIFGHTPQTFGATYEAFLEAVHPDDREMVNRTYTEAINNNTPYECVHRLLRPDGEVRTVLERSEDIVDENGKTIHSIGMTLDITERKLAEEEIWKLNDELEDRVRERTVQLEAANQELEAFAYSVSHELRAPLRSMDGFSRAIVKQYSDSMDGEAIDLFQRIRAASQMMAALIDGLLELARLSRTEMSMADVDLSRLARYAVEYLRNTEHGRNVSFEIMDGLSASGDRNLLQTVLENLLGNAWRFTSGKESALIEFGREDQDGRPVFYVRDNGAGFNMDYVKKLFGPFQRLHSVEDFPGTGVGLASVKRIIARHGGKVWAEGRVGEGATFYFTL